MYCFLNDPMKRSMLPGWRRRTPVCRMLIVDILEHRGRCDDVMVSSEDDDEVVIRVPTPPGKSWFFLENSRPGKSWKITGPGKSWKLKLKVLEKYP